MEGFNYKFNVNLFHVLLIAPLLVYGGYYGSKSIPQVFTAFMALGILVALYHAYKIYERRDQSFSYWKAINIFHILFIAPLFMYIGYNGADTNPQVFTLLLIMAPFILAYHAYRAYENWGSISSKY